MASHTLVCPFLDADPKYALGVEFGMLYAQLRDADEPVSGYFTTANQDQILLAASRLGWSVAEMKQWEEHPDDWFWLRLEKAAAPAG